MKYIFNDSTLYRKKSPVPQANLLINGNIKRTSTHYIILYFCSPHNPTFKGNHPTQNTKMPPIHLFIENEGGVWQGAALDEKLEHTLIMGESTILNSLQDINDKSIGVLVQCKAIDKYSSLKEWNRQDSYSSRFRSQINSLLKVLKQHYNIQSEKVLYYVLNDNHSISHFGMQELRIWQNELPLFKWSLSHITKELAESEYWTRKATSFTIMPPPPLCFYPFLRE